MSDYRKIAAKPSVEKTAESLKANGIEAHVVADAAAALVKLKELVPAGSEVFTMSSITLETIGAGKEFNEGGKYDSVRAKLSSMDQKNQVREMRKYGASPDIALGSAHALAEDGTVIVASLTGSQLAAYASGAGKVVLVVGTQKIVRNLAEGLERIEKYVTPLESARARKAYGLPDTFNSRANKMLILRGEVNPGRFHVILVNEAIGF